MAASFIQSIFWRFTTLVVVKWSCLWVIYKEIVYNIYIRFWNFSKALIITTFPDAACIREIYHWSALQLLHCRLLLAGSHLVFFDWACIVETLSLPKCGFRSSDAWGSLSKWRLPFSGTGVPYTILLHYKGKFALLHFYFNDCESKLDTDTQLYPPRNVIFSVWFLYTLSTFLANVWKLCIKQEGYLRDL